MDYRIPYVGPFSIGWLAPPVTVLWLLFATNAMNFIDGLDGLAGGVALIAAGFLAAIAAAYGGWFAYFAALLLAAGLAGFLPFNFPRARIFMGDVGSQFCGFILGSPGGGGKPLRQRRAVLPDRADAAVRRAVRRGLHPDPPGTCRRSADRAAPRTPVPGGAAHRACRPCRSRSCTGASPGSAGYARSLFLAAPTPAKPFVPLLTLPPQLCWLGFVVASRAGRPASRAGDEPRLLATRSDRAGDGVRRSQ